MSGARQAVEMPVSVGSRIGDAARDAAVAARILDRPVYFLFNGRRVELAPDGDPEAAANEYSAQCARDAEAYSRSPAGRAEERRSREETARCQAEVDRMLAAAESPKTTREWCEWLAEFCSVADRAGVAFDPRGLADRLVAAGWAQGAEVGAGPAIASDPERYARWVMGQAVDLLRLGMPPHPALKCHAPSVAEMLR